MQEADKDDLADQHLMALLNRGAREVSAEAQASGTCACCHKIAVAFTDELSVAEYKISGLCQVCQDDLFAESEDDNTEGEWSRISVTDTVQVDETGYDDPAEREDPYALEKPEPADWNTREYDEPPF